MEYNYDLNISTKEIVSNIDEIIKAQKVERNWKYIGFVDFRKLKVKQDEIVIEKLPSLFNPIACFGTIKLGLSNLNQDSYVKVKIDSHAEYGVVFLFLVFFMISVPVLIISFPNILKVGLFLLVFGAVISFIAYKAIKANRRGLDDYARKVLEMIKGVEM